MACPMALGTEGGTAKRSVERKAQLQPADQGVRCAVGDVAGS